MGFTVMQRQDVQRAEAELSRAAAYARAWLQQMTGGFTGTALLNMAELAAVKNTRDELQRAEEWRTTWRTWAEDAWHPDGYVYKLSHYMQVGKDIASALAFHAKQGFNASAFNLAAEELEQKAERIAQVAEQAAETLQQGAKALAGPWSTATKVKLAAAAVLTLGAVVLMQREIDGASRVVRGDE